MQLVTEHINNLDNQKVIVRCNFDVPIENGQVQDTTRIEDSISTIKLLQDHASQIILISHYDRPDGKPDPEKSLKPVGPILEKLLATTVAFADYQPDIKQVHIDPTAPITLVENLRFWSQEEDNESEFAKTISSWGQAYVNQAFANCHRSHASIVSIPKLLPSYAGVNLAKEIEILTKISKHPDQPLVVVIGGAKLETKEPLVEVFAPIANSILVGGKIAVDLKNKGGVPANVHLADLTSTQRDITLESAQKFADIIKTAKTIVWNGTMGVFEEPEHQQGTRIVAEAINTTPAFTVVGGGDTETALTELNMQSGIDYISSGGGAMLTFLSEGSLVGIDALG